MIESATELSAITRLFSPAVVRELARKGRSPLFRRLIEMARIPECSKSPATVGEAFDAAFARLKVTGQRDEYIYRAALTKKVLMGKHSLRTASMLSEFRAGASKADLVILNGTSVVYEIKSERDKLDRLATQIDDYRRVFAMVNVITNERYANRVGAIVPEDVGILCLSKRYKISRLREAIEQPSRICPLTVFESLRTAEAAAILEALEVSVPEVPNTKRRSVMRARFAELDPVALHHQLVRTLKRTRDLAPLSELVDQLPECLHAAALSISMRRADHDRLARAVAVPLAATASWV